MAEVIDDGPGKGIILIPFLTHSFTKIAPGSETPGVPASEIREIIDPVCNRLIILYKFLDSLNLWFEINFDLIPCFLSSTPETLKSSHKI